MVLDLVMPDLDGLGVLARMREAGIDSPVIVQTAHGGIDNVVSAMRAGAVDFVVKPVGAERLQVSLRNALDDERARGRTSSASSAAAPARSRFKDIVTRSARMQARAAHRREGRGLAIPVLIEGESGVGKELIARAIHGSGERRAKPFVAVNCGAIPDNLVESILFGHEKGAFTGATEKHTGKFVEASGGTLFLDEVGELPPAAQVKLLRAIQEGEVEPVGARKPVKVDVRIISATNRDLIADVKPAASARTCSTACTCFRSRCRRCASGRRTSPTWCGTSSRGSPPRRASASARSAARRWRCSTAIRWPGNVRQLENAVFRAVVLAEGDEHRRRRIPADRRADRRQAAAIAARGAGGAGARTGDCAEVPSTARSRRRRSRRCTAARRMTRSPLLDAHGDVRPLEEIEAEVIRFAIAHYRGQMSEVARRLQIGRSTLYRKLENLGLAERSHEERKEPAGAH